MLRVECGDQADNLAVGLSALNMKKLGLEEGSPVLLIGKKQMKSIGIAMIEPFVHDESITLHDSMFTNLR